ncbi:BEM46 family protein-like protein [Erysiphe pulchra]|uniref:BEM46 family protein-like protein n=1 Tax=Erysiphe pulchra TaxID=225359 RepID=A0A2S4PW59_9PEZI|nr:BEM46 family protein-like protein [Erysiphe pulchra]
MLKTSSHAKKEAEKSNLVRPSETIHALEQQRMALVQKEIVITKKLKDLEARITKSSGKGSSEETIIYPSNFPENARIDVPKPSRFGLNDYEDLKIPTPDGEHLSAYYIRAPESLNADKNTIVLMFHGNAGNIGHRVPIAKILVQRMGLSVFMLEYRGYGLSTGSPDETGFMIDAQTAFAYIREREDTKNHNIVVYGQSIGGAVSIQLVVKNQDDSHLIGLILENTFLSMRKLIPSVIPSSRFIALLCHQVWASEDFIPFINKVPILFLSGLKDEIVPPEHMRRLFEICQSTKIWKPLPSGDHNSSVLEPGYFETIEDFLSNLDVRKKEN